MTYMVWMDVAAGSSASTGVLQTKIQGASWLAGLRTSERPGLVGMTILGLAATFGEIR